MYAINHEFWEDLLSTILHGIIAHATESQVSLFFKILISNVVFGRELFRVFDLEMHVDNAFHIKWLATIKLMQNRHSPLQY